MHKEKTYPYSPLRLLYMAEGKPQGEKYSMWLIVFLMRLNLVDANDDAAKVTRIKEFVKRHEV